MERTNPHCRQEHEADPGNKQPDIRAFSHIPQAGNPADANHSELNESTRIRSRQQQVSNHIPILAGRKLWCSALVGKPTMNAGGQQCQSTRTTTYW